MANDKFDLSDLGASSADLSDLGAAPIEQQQPNPLAGGRFGLAPFTLGAASALANTATGALNLLPGVNIPKWEPSSGPGYEAGKLAGDIGSYLIPGKVITAGPKALVASAEAAKTLGKTAPELSALTKLLGSPATLAGITRRALGSGLLGAATTEGDYGEKGMGALKGAGISAALDIPTAGLAGLTGAAGKLGKSQQMAENIVDSLKSVIGKSETPIEDMGKSIAKDVNTAYEKQLKVANSFYNPVLDKFSDSKLYEGDASLNSKYLNLNPKTFEPFSPDLTTLHEEFLKNPTFQNAHKLQSDLGIESRRLEKMGERNVLTSQDNNVLQYLNRARGALKSDINSFLGARDEGLAKLYNDASNYFRENVGPFRNQTAIFKMAEGSQTNPKNIANIFRNPNEAPNNDLMEVIDKAGPEIKNKILYSGIAQSLARGVTPEKLLNAAMDLDKKGLGSYATPEFREQLSDLLAQMNKEGNIRKGVGFVSGALIAPHLTGGLPINRVLSEMLGGLGGAGLAAKSGGLGAISTALKGLQKTYPWLRTPVASYLTRGNR